MNTGTRNRARLNGAVVAGLAALLLSAATPAAAAGAIAPTSYGASFKCLTRTVEIGLNTGMRLTRITVNGPTEMPHWPTQTVAWRLVVQRRYDGAGWAGTPWKRIFTSVIQKVTVTPDEPLAFTKLTARIGYVDAIDRWPNGYHTMFRTVLHFYWYDTNGIVEHHETYAGGAYYVFRDGSFVWIEYGMCQGLWWLT